MHELRVLDLFRHRDIQPSRIEPISCRSPLKPSSRRCYAKLSQIGLLKADEPGLAERHAEVLFKHGLEDGPGYPLPVDEDAARHAGAHRLKQIPRTLRDYNDLVVVLQVPALQLPVGGGV